MSEFPQYLAPNSSNMLKLSIGQPSPLFLKKAFSALNCCKLSNDHNLMQYGKTCGPDSFRSAIADLVNQYTDKEEEIEPSDIYLTNGITQAINMLINVYYKIVQTTSQMPIVYVEDATYFLALNMFKDMGFKIGVMSLNRLNEFEKELKHYEMNGITNIMLYIIPFHQNPTGSSITDCQREKLKEICNKFKDLLVISDETYQMLSFDYEYTSKKSLALLSPNIVSMGTFSKIFAPSVRTGWLICKNKKFYTEQLDKLGFMDSGGGVNPIMANFMTHLITNLKLTFMTNLRFIKDTLESNCLMLSTVLDKYPNHFEYIKPSGGYFLWVKTKKVDSYQLLKIAEKNKIYFLTGDKFSPCCDHKDYFRLSFSHYNTDDLLLFDERMGNIIKDIDEIINGKIVVNILGSTGRLGKLICELIEETQNMVLGKCINRDMDLTNIGNQGYREIIVDVSSITGTTLLLNKLIENNIKLPLIIGTTGDLPNELIKLYSSNAKVIVCPNFSVGVNVVSKMLENITEQDYWDIEITDIHHVNKKDAPSGTAKQFAKAITNSSHIEPNIVSKREGDVIGFHQILLESPYETITITHNAKDRKLFATGCVRMINSIFNYNDKEIQ